jgi:hypothetical protein
MEEHALHRAKLHAHLEALHEHILRWRERTRIE